MRIAFDIETDNLLDEMTKVHCIVARDIDSNTEWIADATTGYDEMIDILNNAELLIAHNGIGFDEPVLRKMFPNFKPTGKSFDTLIMCRAMYHDVVLKDYGRCKAGRLPARLKGSHSLEAYGYRLRELKGDFGKQENAWEVYTEEMLEYCQQDVVVLKKLYLKILSDGASPEMIELENEFAIIIQRQMEKGVCFDEEAAIKLMIDIRVEKDKLYEELRRAFPIQVVSKDLGKVTTSKVNNRKRCITRGAQFCKITYQEFNPNSRQQITERLIKKYNWTPDDVTEKGTIKVNENILNDLDYPEAKLLSRAMMLGKRLAQISDGNQAWLKKVKGGRIYGRVNTGGAISGRCTHSSPNLAQVPSISSPFGKQCRSLFTAEEGKSIVGCDASGLELRCLSHYLARFDGGEYAEIVLNGDIHTANQEAAGLPTRNMAKTFIYGWLYGAGAVKIGKIVGGGAKEGGKLQSKFMKKFSAIKKLKEAVVSVVETKGYIKGLDGRRMRTRSPHSALNLLLQGAGALVMKRWLIEVMKVVDARGLDATPVLNVHDEAQFEVREDQAEELAQICEDCMKLAGEHFNFRIPIEGESKIGKTWKDTH